MKLKRVIVSIIVGLPLIAGVILAYLEYRVRNPMEEVSAAKTSTRPRPPANTLRNAYFGELHLHTAISSDANIFDARNGPRRAYEFAKGGEMELPGSRQKQRLPAPLDFAAITDHAEGMGTIHQCFDRNSGSYWVPSCLGMRHQFLLMFPLLFANAKQDGKNLARYSDSMCGERGGKCIDGAKSVWQDNQRAAEEHYEPGYFTTFNGFEYSPTLFEGGMLHRNVIFRGNKVPTNVFSAMDGFAEDLLRWLDLQCKGDCQVLTIPHNPNFSWGLMFGESNSDGTPITKESLALRARYDALIEIFQAKGGSECTVGIGTTDEQCGFENVFPACTAEEAKVSPEKGQHAPKCVANNDMVRNILKKGLVDEKALGFNPFKFGIIAATDNHNGAPGDTQESTWNGHGGVNDAFPEQRLGIKRGIVSKMLNFKPAVVNPGGLAGVWAEENTREAIWDALKRKESFGTSGTRVRARFFAGYDFPADLHTRSDAIKFAYANGVPMGGDLSPAAAGKAPSLLVYGVRDPNSAPLQRIQVVKGWVSGGEPQERVFDAVCSDGIFPDPLTHRCASNGAKVKLSDCSISKDKGATELATTWKDPEFDPALPAFYYVRILENPVCRYSLRDALKLGVEHPPNVPPTIQERAWTSPIWYQSKTQPRNPS
ncbi:MAG: DUF3604 domain-containing protein [Rhodocyclaceae bacterium]|nr:DUF3604 domain-containing protein [Rhodocyclaceae bacterium]